MVAAASSPSGGGERRRVRRSEFPEEKQRDCGRDRTERSYPAQEHQRQKEHEYRAGRQKRQAAFSRPRPFT